jgi:signal transduction histidine kinase
MQPLSRAVSNKVTGSNAGDVQVRTEERIARIIAYVRVSTSAFVYLPLIGWERLEQPVIALCAALASSVEATWFYRRVRRAGTVQVSSVVWADVAFCVALIVIGSRAAFPGQPNAVTTELVPFALVSAACAGFGLRAGFAGILAVAALMITWTVSMIPDVTLKLASDLLGFVLWYVVALLMARELRSLSRQDVAAEGGRWLAERQAEMARHQMHDVLLPIVEQVASGAELSEDFVRRLRREAGRARRLLDPRASPESGLRALLLDVCETFTEHGLHMETVIAIRGEPPADVAAALAAATREALNNVRKHCGSCGPVLIRADGGPDHVEIVVRDRGQGFDPRTVRAGGGFTVTFRAIHRCDCACDVESSPGAGTKVTITWPAGDKQ